MIDTWFNTKFYLQIQMNLQQMEHRSYQMAQRNLIELEIFLK